MLQDFIDEYLLKAGAVACHNCVGSNYIGYTTGFHRRVLAERRRCSRFVLASKPVVLPRRPHGRHRRRRDQDARQDQASFRQDELTRFLAAVHRVRLGPGALHDLASRPASTSHNNRAPRRLAEADARSQ